jgi:hypothetical protein
LTPGQRRCGFSEYRQQASKVTVPLAQNKLTLPKCR